MPGSIENRSPSAPTAVGPIAPWRVGSAILSGSLVVISFPLFGSDVGLDGIVWLSLAPLFLGVVGVGGRPGAILGFCAGITIEAAGFLWILLAIRRFTGLPSSLATAGFLGWALYSSIPWVVLGAALGRCRRPADTLWVLPLWVGVEDIFPRLFPWHLGGALHEREWLVQTADVWGASGLTGLVFLSSACVYRLSLFVARRGPFPSATVGLFGILVAGSLVYGRARLDSVLRSEAEFPLLHVAVIQGGLEPDARGRDALEQYLEATESVLRQGKADLIVWPEGAASGDSWLPFDLDPERNPRGADWARKEARPLLAKAVSAWGTPLVTGGMGFSAARIPRLSNVLVVFMPGEAPRFYEKNHRLFLGEKVPFLDLMPESIQSRFENVGTLAAGTDQPKFQLGPVAFRGLICYEAVLPGYVRRCSAGVDFLCNVTEDVWYGRTAHVPQHVSVLRLRAIESRVPIVRSANMGPSGVMGMSGRFDRGARAFAPEERIVALRAGSLRSMYSQWGYLLPWILLAVPFVRGAFLLARRRASPARPAA